MERFSYLYKVIETVRDTARMGRLVQRAGSSMGRKYLGGWWPVQNLSSDFHFCSIADR